MRLKRPTRSSSGARAAAVTGRPVRSYRTFSPLPARRSGLGRYIFCGTFPGVAPGGRYPPPCPLEPGLSSIRSSGRRPPARPIHHYSKYALRLHRFAEKTPPQAQILLQNPGIRAGPAPLKKSPCGDQHSGKTLGQARIRGKTRGFERVPVFPSRRARLRAAGRFHRPIPFNFYTYVRKARRAGNYSAQFVFLQNKKKRAFFKEFKKNPAGRFDVGESIG